MLILYLKGSEQATDNSVYSLSSIEDESTTHVLRLACVKDHGVPQPSTMIGAENGVTAQVSLAFFLCLPVFLPVQARATQHIHF